jgi:hypothetical protein
MHSSSVRRAQGSLFVFAFADNQAVSINCNSRVSHETLRFFIPFLFFVICMDVKLKVAAFS